MCAIESAAGLPIVTECFFVRDGAVLLGRKKRGLGAGKIVGIGGHVEPGETPLQAAAREVFEEIQVLCAPHELEARGQLDFRFPAKPAWSMLAHVFVARAWTGTPAETDEIAPLWVAFDAIPFDQMWADARHWLTGVLRGGSIDAVFTFNDDNATLKSILHRGR